MPIETEEFAAFSRTLYKTTVGAVKSELQRARRQQALAQRSSYGTQARALGDTAGENAVLQFINIKKIFQKILNSILNRLPKSVRGIIKFVIPKLFKGDLNGAVQAAPSQPPSQPPPRLLTLPWPYRVSSKPL